MFFGQKLELNQKNKLAIFLKKSNITLTFLMAFAYGF